MMLQQLISPAGFQRVQLVAAAPSRLCRPLRSALLLLLGDEPEVRVRPEPCHHADSQAVRLVYTLQYWLASNRDGKGKQRDVRQEA